uniref:Uncharacterized protein n=1 Tax=Panagrolaimus sp. PS1159 TaxID=55785 RepID=A0AC35GVE3_9BILA
MAYENCEKKNRSQPRTTQHKKTTLSKADIAANVKTPTKKNDDLEAAKIEPTQMPKKEKKPKTPEPTTAEHVPENKIKKKTKTLESKTNEDAVSKQEPPTPASKEPAPTEHQHEVLASEINLLYVPVNRRIVTVLKGARQFLKDPTTDATKLYFAFGAEYHHLITDDPEIIEKASIPLLYVVALQLRLLEASRRKACAIMRRKLVKFLAILKLLIGLKCHFLLILLNMHTAVIQSFFYDPSGIKTNSGSNGKKKEKIIKEALT